MTPEIKCPSCQSTSIKHRARTGRYFCEHCANSFTYGEIVGYEKKAGKPKTNSGSGQVAGKITIGRGSNWKAGFV